MAEKMAAAVASTGSNFVEFKVGVYPVATDIDTIAAVRDRLGPHISIGVDANMAWDFDTADKFMAATRAYGLSNVEEPVSNLADMNRLAERHGVNVSSHATSPETLRHYPAIDGAVGEPHAEGSLMGCRACQNVWQPSASAIGFARPGRQECPGQRCATWVSPFRR